MTTHRWAGQPAELARVYVMLAFDEGSSSPARGWRSPAAARPLRAFAASYCLFALAPSGLPFIRRQ